MNIFKDKAIMSYATISFFTLEMIFIAIGIITTNTTSGTMINPAGSISTNAYHPISATILGLLAIGFHFIAKKTDSPLKVKYIAYFLLYPSIIATITYLLVTFNLIIISYLFLIIMAVLILVEVIKTLFNKEDMIAYVNNSNKEIDDDEGLHDEAAPGDFTIGYRYKRNIDEEGKIPDGEDAYVLSENKAILHLHDRFVHVMILGVTGSGKTSQSLLPMFVQDFNADNFQYEDISVVQMGQIILEPKGDFAKTAWAIGSYYEKEKRKHYMSFLYDIEKRFQKQLSSLNEQRQSYLIKQSGRELTKDEEKKLNHYHDVLNQNDVSDAEKIEVSVKKGELEDIKNGVKLTIVEKDGLELIENSMKKLLYVKKELPKYIKTNDFDDLDKKTTFALFRYASLLTDIIANPSKLESSWNDLVTQDPQEKRDLIMLFDPSAKDPVYFNPLFGKEEVAVGTVTTTLIAFMADSTSYFQTIAKELTQNAIKIAKRVHGNDATLMHVNDLFTNNSSRGEELIKRLMQLPAESKVALENRDLASYFTNNYYAGLKGDRGAPDTYKNASGVRGILNNLLDNSRLRNVLNPPVGIGTSIDFDKILRTGDKVAISTATGVSDELGKMLGSFLILQLQAAIFRRPGSESTRTPVILYIDEFQDYATSSFEDVLTKGRSYVVSATMATQTLGIVENKAGKGLVDNLQSNARNVIIYPGASVQDAKYFVSLFGTIRNKEVKRSVSQEVEEELSGFDKAKALIGLSGDEAHGGGPRESVSEQVNNDERFDETQVIYGPNVHQRTKTANDAFGSIFFRIVNKNSNQTPAVAKIEYIPYELKKITDRIVSTYDSVNDPLNEKEVDNQQDSDLTIDPLQKDSDFNDVVFTNELVNNENDKKDFEDPSKLVRDETGKNAITSSQDGEKIEDINVDDIKNSLDAETLDIETDKIDKEDLPSKEDLQPDLPDLSDLNNMNVTGTDINDISPDDLTTLFDEPKI